MQRRWRVLWLVGVAELVACGGAVESGGPGDGGGADSGVKPPSDADVGPGDSGLGMDSDRVADVGPPDSTVSMDASDSAPIGPAPMCLAPPGAFPASNCDDSAQMCPAVGGCALACIESTAPGACEPLADNTGKTTLDFRMRWVQIAAPTALANMTVQGSVVTPAVSLSAAQAPGCGEMGSGTFNWLLSVNKAAGTLTTGGAPPSATPFTTGYCFSNTTAAGSVLAPVTGPITFTGSTFTSSPLLSVLDVPIFIDTLADPLVFPIRAATFHDVTISPDTNCIGSFNPTALDSKCADDPTTCTKWHTSGAVAGYITLKDADNVNISLLGESLCVLLTGTGATKTAAGKCPPSAFTMGDYCSSPAGPGGCGDSEWFAATFAASAVTINSGAGVPGCM
jgi:hypothetical protein